jgi:heptosyltransferase-2
MARPETILVFHTAFIGDIVLMVPMIHVLRRSFPQARISVVAIPASASVLRNNPAIDEIIEYDKKGRDRGVAAALRLARILKARRFDTAIVPHRSLRSAAIVRLAGIPVRVGFSTSSGKWLLTETVEYRKDLHEITRDLHLLKPLSVTAPDRELPELFPSEDDRLIVERLIASCERGGGGFDRRRMVAVAPGSVWKTKRWPREKYEDLCRLLLQEGASIVLIGGDDDMPLCREIASDLRDGRVLDASGSLSLLQSAEMIRRCSVLVSNDSAPLHLAVSVRTPVIAIFGATVPAFGFAPIGAHDTVVEIQGLKCRPCAIHGGNKCPVRTFDCMMRISPETVLDKVHEVMHVSDDSGRSG